MPSTPLSSAVFAYQHPDVRAYLEYRDAQLKARRRARGHALPAAAVGAIGVGARLNWLGNKAFTPEDRLKLDNLASLSSRMDQESAGLISANPGKEFTDSGQLFYDYVDRASEAASARPYGQPVQDFIIRLRKSPIFKGTSFDMAKSDPFWLKQSENHYRDFEAGPLAAYMHQLDKHDASFNGSLGATSAFMDPAANDKGKALERLMDKADQYPLLHRLKAGLVKSYIDAREKMEPMKKHTLPSFGDGSNKDTARDIAHWIAQRAPKKDTYHEFHKDLDRNMNSFLKTEGVSDKESPVDSIREISQSLPHGKEMDLLRKFRGWAEAKDPEFSKTLGKLESTMAAGMTGPARLYAFGGGLATRLLQDVPKVIGGVLMAGGTAAGLVWLYQRVRAQQLKKKLEGKKRLAMKALQPKSASYAGYQNHNLQQLLPIAGRRDLTRAELLAIAQGKDQWLPKIFDNLGDDPSVNLASPGKQSLLWGAGLGLPTALMAAANSGSATAGLGAGTMVGGAAALLAYLNRQRQNADIEETMRRLPPGSTLRDFAADPLMAERRQMAHEQALALSRNLATSYR